MQRGAGHGAGLAGESVLHPQMGVCVHIHRAAVGNRQLLHYAYPAAVIFRPRRREPLGRGDPKPGKRSAPNGAGPGAADRCRHRTGPAHPGSPRSRQWDPPPRAIRPSGPLRSHAARGSFPHRQTGSLESCAEAVPGGGLQSPYPPQ